MDKKAIIEEFNKQIEAETKRLREPMPPEQKAEFDLAWAKLSYQVNAKIWPTT